MNNDIIREHSRMRLQGWRLWNILTLWVGENYSLAKIAAAIIVLHPL